MVDVHDGEVRTDSRAIVDQLRNKLRSPLRFRVPHGPIPVENAGAVRIGIEVAFQMRKDALSRDYVRNTVAIEIAKGHAMQLGKGHISGIFRRKIAHNGMLYEGNGAVLVALLLEPCESPSVSVKSRDDVVQTVAVHVINTHLGAADAEGCRMICPRLLRGTLRRMFPPSTGGYDVHAAITVD